MANPILEAIERIGVQIMDADKAAIEGEVSKLVYGGVTEVATILESKLPTSGLASLADGEIKSIISAAEPQVEALVTGEFDSLYAALETALKNAEGPVAPAANG